jgi:hypothetical protein
MVVFVKKHHIPRGSTVGYYSCIKEKENNKLLIWENKKIVLENEKFCFVVIFLSE